MRDIGVRWLIAMAQWLVLVVGAPFLISALRAAPIWIRGQQAPSPVQPLMDLLKLARHRSEIRSDLSVIMLAAHGGAVLTAATLVPVWSTTTAGKLLQIDDLFLFFGLLALSRILLSVLSVHAGGSHSALGVGRLFGLVGTMGPTWICAVIAVGVGRGTTTISAVTTLAVKLDVYPIWLFLFLACSMALLMDIGHAPLDDLGSSLDMAHADLVSQAELGPREKLILSWARSLRLSLLTMLTLNLFYPLGVVTSPPSGPLDGKEAPRILSVACGFAFLIVECYEALSRPKRQPLWILHFVFVLGAMFTPLVLVFLLVGLAQARLAPKELRTFVYFPLLLALISMLASAVPIH